MKKIFSALIRLNIAWAFISPILIALALNALPETILLFALKDFFLYVALLIALVFAFRREGYVALVGIGGLLAYMFLSFFALNPEYAAPAANARQIVSPLIILLFGAYVPIHSSGCRKSFLFAYKISFVIVMIGVLFLVVDVWSHLSLRNYFLAKGIPVDSRGLSYMFYEPIIGYRQRMVSTVLDPISLGHTLAAIFTCAWYRIEVKGLYRLIILGVTGAGILLTFSKGAMLEVFLAIIVFNPSVWLVLKLVGAGGVAVIVMLLPTREGIMIHVNGAINAVKSVSLFGFGLGAVGNYTKMFSDDLSVYEEAGISDTFLGSLLGQLGVAGMLIWLSVILFIVRSREHSHSEGVARRIVVATLVIAAVSENVLNFTSFLVPGVLAGLLTQRERLMQRDSSSV